MKHTHSHQELGALLKTLTHKDDVHFLTWVEVNSVLGKFWSERFSSSEYLVLLFILNRTLVFRKKAEVIPKKHFINGIESGRGVTCRGCGVGEATLAKALDALCKQDFINIHCFKEGHVEAVARVYEINCSKILEGYDTEEVQNMLKRSKKALYEEAQNAQKGDSIGGTLLRGEGGQNRGGITELLHSSISSSFKEEETDSEDEGSGPRLRVGKRRMSRGAISCTKEPTLLPGNAKERLEQMQNLTKSTRAARLHSVRSMPERRWDMKDLQALLDEARSRSGVAVPRIMATSKGAGVLFKRMKDAEVVDTLEFFTWTLRNWGMVANANRRSKARQLKEEHKVSSEMSLIPNFQDLAYRLPYIMVFFNERKFTEVQAKDEKVAKASAVKTMADDQRQAIDRRRSAVREQDLRRREEDKQAEQRFTERRRRPRIEQAPDSDEPLPAFREREWRG